MKRAIVSCLLILGPNADMAKAADNTPWHGLIIRENWTLEAAVEGLKEQWREMPFIRAWAYAEAIDRYCFPAKSYTKVVGVGVAETAKSQDRFSPGMLASAERDAADHLRGEYLACAPAMQFVEETVARMPELVEKLNVLQMQINDVKAKIATACAIRAREGSPPLKICIGGYLPD